MPGECVTQEMASALDLTGTCAHSGRRLAQTGGLTDDDAGSEPHTGHRPLHNDRGSGGQGEPGKQEEERRERTDRRAPGCIKHSAEARTGTAVPQEERKGARKGTLRLRGGSGNEETATHAADAAGRQEERK